MTKEPLINLIDDVLPQTQCGLCGYGGCRPYAEAIARDNERINCCPPGGIKTLQDLARITQIDATPYVDDMLAKSKGPRKVVIREDECIGCTKCIQVCPVDAILGSAKKMHTVIADECTGCELCIAPCPVDCIDVIAIAPLPDHEQQQKANIARRRYEARQQRLSIKDTPTEKSATIETMGMQSVTSRKNAIQEAIERVKTKRSLLNES